MGKMIEDLLRIGPLFLVAASPIFCGLIAPRLLPDLQQTADLIVVGAGTSAPSVGTTVHLSLQVNRVLKGDSALAGSVLAVSWPNAINGMRPASSLPPSTSGLWFLKNSSTGWVLVPVVQGDISVDMAFFPVPGVPVSNVYAYAAAASLSDKIASELCYGIESLGGAYNFQLYALAGRTMDQLNSSIIAVHNQRMSEATSPQQRILGLGGLIRSGSSAALVSASQEAPTFEMYPKEHGMLIGSIREYFRATDAASVAALGQAATDSTNPAAFREAAAHALAAIHSASTLPYLATLLNDSDETLRVQAIGGMGSFANGLPIQTRASIPSLTHLQIPANAQYRTADTLANFAMGSQAIQQNETSYVLFWQQWWSQNRASLGF